MQKIESQDLKAISHIQEVAIQVAQVILLVEAIQLAEVIRQVEAIQLVVAIRAAVILDSVEHHLHSLVHRVFQVFLCFTKVKIKFNIFLFSNF